uniref:Secreted protein n=1 Tax=Lutzomyia longipalpis TaxID=7200 RepID=A0A1B0CQY1_LUTLO
MNFETSLLVIAGCGLGLLVLWCLCCRNSDCLAEDEGYAKHDTNIVVTSARHVPLEESTYNESQPFRSRHQEGFNGMRTVNAYEEASAPHAPDPPYPLEDTMPMPQPSPRDDRTSAVEVHHSSETTPSAANQSNSTPSCPPQEDSSSCPAVQSESSTNDNPPSYEEVMSSEQ